ncbi:MAG: hypothetical protein AOA65_0215 [Candidatus Bathyarchaeota archaeon BA1]|nr:MAG: hypothetical protein AOA65_0215 [Candidatus Bathyarchaeota archaeon BA1]
MPLAKKNLYNHPSHHRRECQCKQCDLYQTLQPLKNDTRTRKIATCTIVLNTFLTYTYVLFLKNTYVTMCLMYRCG